MIRYAFLLSALAIPSPAQHSTVPVVLVDGYDPSGCLSLSTATQTFGQLAGLLQPTPSVFFDNCQDPNASIDRLGADFGQALAKLGSGPVDVIAHSMGGLIVRAYLAGLNISNSAANPPLQPGIRKLVLVGTPNFGSGFANLALNSQGAEMIPGSGFLWDLNTWNQQSDDLRGIDTVAIAGNGQGDGSDGVVTVSSASLAFAFSDGDQRTRVIGAYCHTNNVLYDLGTLCLGGAIAYVTGPTHPSYQIIRSFLDGTDEWKSVGVPASQASATGGFLWNLRTADDNGWPPSGPPEIVSSSGAVAFLKPSPSFSDVWYDEAFSAGVAELQFSASGQSYTVNNIAILPGAFTLLINKLGPKIYRDGVVSSAGIPPGALSIASDSLISIYGAGFADSAAVASYPWPASLNNVVVTIDRISCLLNYAGPNQVNAYVPAGLAPAAHVLTLQNSDGQHRVRLMIESAVPTLFAEANNTAAALHANYQPISTSSPAAIGESVSLFATGLGPVSSRNGLLVANTTPQVWIDGVGAAVSFAGRAPGYQGLDQINVQIPGGIHRGVQVPVVITSGSRTSNQVLLSVN